MIYLLAACLGLLPVLPMIIKGSPVLNNDMLVAYFCYFWDFHRNWSWSHPLVFWSSSYQCGMPMHAYWQSGFLYPITWILFGPLSPHYGIHLFYAFHFFLGIAGFLRLGPRLRLGPAASLWAGICFALSGTMLARYEHATFLAGWAWIPLVLSAFLSLRDNPGPKALFWYASAVALQALGGHPQASVATAILISAFTVTFLLRGGAGGKAGAGPKKRRVAWVLGGHALAMLYCAPLLVPFLQLVDGTDRFDGVAWEGEMPGPAKDVSAAEKLEAGVFGFEKFATGGMRPVHLLSLIAPNALGSPSNATWWGGEVWGEVFVYLGGLGLFCCFFASPKRANRDLRWIWIMGLAGLWLAFGAHLGASQILYHLPVLNNFRRPARFLILFAFALAALSGHGLQRWLGSPRGKRSDAVVAIVALVALHGACGLAGFRFFPGAGAWLLQVLQGLKHLDSGKDYGPKISALLGRAAVDLLCLALSAAAVLAYMHWRQKVARAGNGKLSRWRLHRFGLPLLFLVLSGDLLRVHWDHFYLFPAGYYRHPPASARVLDAGTSPYWRVSHYLEYPGLELWQLHNDPLAHFDLLEREKTALSCGIHAVFGYRHVTAHLPLMWKWDARQSYPEKSARYLFTNLEFTAFKGDSLGKIGRFDSVNVYEFKDWRPRLELASRRLDFSATQPACEPGFSGHGGLCVQEIRDGQFDVRGNFQAGDTLLVRERFLPEWRQRADGGAWSRPFETADHFLAVPLTKVAQKVELEYRPSVFYRCIMVCAALTAALLGCFGLRRFRKDGG
ncbi:MAG: hypothetical protein ABI036_13580 [Fibrobacteria bacterium]